MKKISAALLAEVVHRNRKNKKWTLEQLAEQTGIHRTMISRIEKE